MKNGDDLYFPSSTKASDDQIGIVLGIVLPVVTISVLIGVVWYCKCRYVQMNTGIPLSVGITFSSYIVFILHNMGWLSERTMFD